MSSLETQYIPLALKHRPRKFLDLMGQDVLVQTLSSAIINSRLAHAYLLTGIRGVGKTTSARLIASIVNCETPSIKDANIEICGTCNNCKSFANGNHPDIIEIDAASRTSVDDVRIIIESAEYRPLLGKYKIFIIDEVHMLSKSAFNALLKTLEEPPAKVIFIFATTEVNKIPITILSRCQRFDLKRFTTKQIYDLLAKIAKTENIACEDKALSLIALKSDGSARDAISMLDQASLLLSSGNHKTINLTLVHSMLGVSNFNVIIAFITSVLNQDTKAALEVLQEVHLNGSDLVYFMENVLNIIGYITKLSALPDYRDSEYDTYRDSLHEIASKTGLEVLTILWQIFNKGILELKTSHNQFLSAEMLTIRAIYASTLPSPREAIGALSSTTLRPRQ